MHKFPSLRLATVVAIAGAAHFSTGYAQTAVVTGISRDTTASADSAAGTRFLPKGSEWLRAGEEAILDRGTIIPGLAAVAMIAGGWDAKITRWAASHSILFSSAQHAARNSDDYLRMTQILMLGSALLARDKGRPVHDRVDRVAWEQVGSGVTYLATAGGKAAFRRLRPDESNYRSFPSGHASMATYSASTAMRNFSEMGMSHGLHVGADIAAGLLGAACAWSRVEAGVHYPTDVLVGAALGNALSVFVYELYDGRKAPPISVRLGASGSVDISTSIKL
jgi:membrane-associated phospholipid phosphatase